MSFRQLELGFILQDGTKRGSESQTAEKHAPN